MGLTAVTPALLMQSLGHEQRAGVMFIVERNDGRGPTAGAAAFFDVDDAMEEMLERVVEYADLTAAIRHPEWQLDTDLAEMLPHIDEPDRGIFHWQSYEQPHGRVFVVVCAGHDAVEEMGSLLRMLSGDDGTVSEEQPEEF